MDKCKNGHEHWSDCGKHCLTHSFSTNYNKPGNIKHASADSMGRKLSANLTKYFNTLVEVHISRLIGLAKSYKESDYSIRVNSNSENKGIITKSSILNNNYLDSWTAEEWQNFEDFCKKKFR